MSAPVQTILALIVVAIALAYLVRRAVVKHRNGGCGTDCGAISPEIRRLQAKLKRAGK